MHNVHKIAAMSTAYVSGRVPPRYERLVVKQARAAKTSKSDLVARYVIEKSLENEFQIGRASCRERVFRTV